MKLLFSACTKLILGIIIVGLLLFLPAGGFDYPGAWLFMALLFVPMTLLGIVLFIKSPALLAKRLQSREKESGQRRVVGLSALLFLAGFIAAGLDHRFSLTHVPLPVVITASVVLLASYAMYAEVMRENAYLSRTVEVQSGQKVIDTGLYGIVRHPMYTSVIFLFLSIPLVLGSFISFVIFLIFPALLIARIKNEEAVLRAGLAGYDEYTKRVKYRLFPFIY